MEIRLAAPLQYDSIVDGAGFTDDEDDEEANTPSDSGESHSTVTDNRREQRQPGGTFGLRQLSHAPQFSLLYSSPK